MADKKDVTLGTPNKAGEIVIGLVSDTHGLLRPEVLEAFRNVTGIIHAGDIGRPEILISLRKLAPTLAVRGNVDHGAWAEGLPSALVVTIGAVRAYVHHGHEVPEPYPTRAGCQVVVSGHSHKPGSEPRDGVLYVNPGSAGPRRFKLPVTLMRLRVVGQDAIPEWINLA